MEKRSFVAYQPPTFASYAGLKGRPTVIKTAVRAKLNSVVINKKAASKTGFNEFRPAFGAIFRKPIAGSVMASGADNISLSFVIIEKQGVPPGKQGLSTLNFFIPLKEEE